MVSVNRVIGKIDLLKHLILAVIKGSSEHPQKRSMLHFPSICKIHSELCQPVLQQLKKQQ